MALWELVRAVHYGGQGTERETKHVKDHGEFAKVVIYSIDYN